MIREYIIRISDEVIADAMEDIAPELVRCKNCKDANCCEIAFCFGEKADWFCANGERRADDD